MVTVLQGVKPICSWLEKCVFPPIVSLKTTSYTSGKWMLVQNCQQKLKYFTICENFELLGALKGNSRELKVITGSVLGGPSMFAQHFKEIHPVVAEIVQSVDSVHIDNNIVSGKSLCLLLIMYVRSCMLLCECCEHHKPNSILPKMFCH